MTSIRTTLALCVFVLSGVALAQETVVTLDGDVPTGEETHFFLPFDVPAGTGEIEVAHDDLSATNILDWGLDDPNGFRGWGGGNVEPAIVGVDAASRSYLPGPIRRANGASWSARRRSASCRRTTRCGSRCG
jgi:hypothetical protein